MTINQSLSDLQAVAAASATPVRFGHREAKLATVVAAAIPPSGELVITDDNLPVAFTLPVPEGIGHVITTGLGEVDISFITTPADTSKVHYLQVTCLSGDLSTFLFFDEEDPTPSGYSPVSGTSIHLDVNNGTAELRNDCELVPGETILLYWSPTTGIWAAVNRKIVPFVGLG